MKAISKSNEKWNKKFKLLISFTNKYGRFPYFKEKYKGESIGVWYSYNRKKYNSNKLSKKQREKFDTINIAEKQEAIWYQMLSLIKEYKELNGNYPSGYATYKKIEVGKWCQSQRYLYKAGELSEKRIEELKAMGFALEKNENFDMRWETKYELLKEFINENQRLPLSKENYKNTKLGVWLYNQKVRNSVGTLAESRKNKLESIGAFECVKSRPVAWEKNYAKLSAFFAENHRLPKQYDRFSNEPNGFKIGVWYQTQLKKYRENKLTQLQINMLNEISELQPVMSNEEIWNNWFELVVEYIETYKVIPNAFTIMNEKKIGKWIRNQKARYKKGKLSDDKVQKLKDCHLI